MNDTNIDNIVDYKQEYTAAIKEAKITGDRLTGLCPFHKDKNASFSADMKTGKYTCFACGASGNFVTFYAKTHNIPTSDAYKDILEKYHAAGGNPGAYTPAEYAKEKRLPADWIADACKLGAGKEKDGAPWLKIPYFDEDGREVVYRKRFKKGAPIRFKWKYGSAGKLLLYGEWKLPKMRETKYALLVEGESDTQTLWFLGFPALGVPGASTYRPEWSGRLAGLKLYLHIEPDIGGQTFLAQMTRKLKDGGFEGEVYTWSVKDYEVKDPSELFMRDGADEAKVKITAAIKAAKRLDLTRLEEEIPPAIQGAPINFRQPEGWICTDRGISQIDERTALPRVICRTPIILTQRLRSMETGEEKIELAFKRDGEWHTTIQPRSVVFQSRSITSLADLGCTVTSENAKLVVRYLEALEAENIDILEKVESTSTFGWQTGGRFLPGHGGNLILDIEPSLRSWATAYCLNGTLKGWIENMRPHRERDKFRFILAAAFTAPLLRIVRQRIFFVYNWGGSKGGKTAALKAALSAWGDPERLMVNFNATQVALERMANFYCDLPLGIDERQLAGDKQEIVEKIVYMLSSGTGRARGSKTGGLQSMNTWRTVCIATGEEPIARETSQTGVSTRILEFEGKPFEDEKSAGQMHQQASEHFGWAGPAFISRLLDLGEEPIRERFTAMLEYVYEQNHGRNGAHAAGIAAVATADSITDELFFGASPEEATARARQMADTIIKENLAGELRDVNESATQFVADWILSNGQNFTRDARGVCLGEISDGYAYVLPSLLKKALEDGKYSSRKTLKFMADKGILISSKEGDLDRFSIVRRFMGQPCRMIQIDLELLKRGGRPPFKTLLSEEDFTEVGEDEELPF